MNPSSKQVLIRLPLLLPPLLAMAFGAPAAGALLLATEAGLLIWEYYLRQREISEWYAGRLRRPVMAHRLDPASGEVVDVPVATLRPGDRIRLLPGEKLYLEGNVTRYTDSPGLRRMQGVTAEEAPREGASLPFGFLNRFGVLELQITRSGAGTARRQVEVQMARFDRDPQRHKERNRNGILALGMLVLSLVATVLGAAFPQRHAAQWLLAWTPVITLLAVGPLPMVVRALLARYGIILHDRRALSRLAKVTELIFDKTGTLTYGRPDVVDTVSLVPDLTDDEILDLAARAESQSEHPLGRTIVRAHRARRRTAIAPVDRSRIHPGEGVETEADGHRLLVGHTAFFQAHGCEVPARLVAGIETAAAEGKTILLVGHDTKTVGYLALQDRLRDTAPDMVRVLREMGVTPIMVTGDDADAASALTDALALQTIHGRMMPQAKRDLIEAHQAEGAVVGMVGDGMNDAPAADAADLAIGLQLRGSPLTMEASDLCLSDDRIEWIPELLYQGRVSVQDRHFLLLIAWGLPVILSLLVLAFDVSAMALATVHLVSLFLVLIHTLRRVVSDPLF